MKPTKYDDIRVLIQEVTKGDVRSTLLFNFLLERIEFLENKKPTYVPPPVYGGPTAYDTGAAR